MTDQAIKELERFHDRLEQVPETVDQLTGLVPLTQIIRSPIFSSAARCSLYACPDHRDLWPVHLRLGR